MAKPNLIDRIVVQCSIVCDKCGNVEYDDQADPVDAAIKFEKKGWRWFNQDKEWVVCNKCTAKIIDKDE